MHVGVCKVKVNSNCFGRDLSVNESMNDGMNEVLKFM